MSQERPLLHNNIGGFVTTSTTTTTPAPAPAVPSSTTSCVEPSNMVLSAIPLDGHVIIQQAPVPRSAATLTNNYTQIHRGSPSNLITTGSHHHPVTKTTMISGGAPSPSKYVFFQHNGNGQYTTNEAFITTASQQSNNVGGNIVLVATEQMEMGHTENVIASNGTAPGDEELTSLTWLHDKNLIKDIVSCSNGIKSTTTTTTITGQNQQLTNNGNLITGITKGPISPATSDCPDESCASDDNVSLNNLNMDHGINVHHHTGQNDYIQHQHHQIQYTNNNSIIKNRNHIVSPPHASFASTPPLLHENLQAMGATTTVHVGPSGTTTVVEYKTNSNFVPSARHLQSNINTNTTLNNNCQTLHNLNQNSNQNQSVPQSPLRNNNTVVVTSSSIAGGVVPSVASIPSVASVLSQAQTSVTITSTTNTSPTTTTHHPHKKYLQQMNGFDHGGGGGGGAGVSASSNSGSGTSIKVTTNTNGQYNNNNNNNININNNNSNNNNNNNNNDNNTSQSSLPSSPSYSTTYTIPLNQQQTTLTTEVKEQSSCNQNQLINSSQYQHSLLKTPPSYSPNGYETDSLKDYEISSNGGRSSSGAGSITNVNAQKGSPSPKQKHPTNVPYDPLIHTHNKPPYSFSSLIFMAIEDSPEKALPVKEIYAWIVEHFPYFRTAPTGWKNSVRHNLSLNKSFVKVEKAPNMGKGSLWRVEQQQRPNLIHALTRSPFFPCSAVDKISQQNRSSEASSPRGQCSSPPMTPVKSNFDAWLFPKLSKTLKDMVQSNGNGGGSPNETASNDSHTIYALTTNSNGTYTSTPISSYQSIEHLARDCGADSIDDVNAATAMLALKHGPKVFNETFQNGSPVITSSPSEDHTYSAGGSGSGGNSNASTTNSINGNANVSNQTQHNGSDNLSTCASSDAAYESSEESHNISAEQLEEQQRQRDGVDALLSLSSVFDISPIKRRSSTTVEEEHTSSYMENIPHLHGMGSIAIANGGSTTTTSNTNNNHTTVILDEGYNTQSYYSHLVTPTPPKKMKPLRSLRAKIKRKTAWIR